MVNKISVTAENILNDIAREPDDGRVTIGVQTPIDPSVSENIGDRVTGVDLIPYVRRNWIICTMTNMRPDQDYYRATWNDNIGLDLLNAEIAFSEHTAANGDPIGLTRNWDQFKGSTVVNMATSETIQFIKTDSNGYAQFAIRVPEDVHIGDSVVEIRNEASIYAAVGGKDSRANAIYRAHGLAQTIEPTIVTTQVIDTKDSNEPPPTPEPPPQPPPVVNPDMPGCGDRITQAELVALGGVSEIISAISTPTTVVRVNTDLSKDPPEYVVACAPRAPGNLDPLAQSFLTYNEPVYIGSGDLYFRTKSETAPVTVQIRDMVNGYPGAKIIPGSTVVLNPSDIEISTDSSVSTRFQYTGPVYLEPNTRYCLVILSFSTEYELWSSELGQIDILTGNRIQRQPVTGSLFTSQNNVTWTAEQNFDIKYRLNKCNFSTDGENEFINFSPMTGADAYSLIQRTSQITLGNNQIVHPNTDIRWYYRFNKTEAGPLGTPQGLTPKYKLFQPGVNLDLENLTTQVLLKLEFSGGTLTPIVDRERTGIVFLRNLTEGNYITRNMDFSVINPENLKPNSCRGLFLYKAPTNTTISVYMAANTDLDNESDINWRPVVDITNSGGTIESGETTFTSDPTGDQLLLDSDIGLYTGQAVSFSGVTGSPELTGTLYVRPVTDVVVKVYNSEADAINDVNDINITAGNGTIVRSSRTRYSQSTLPGGWTEAHFDYDFAGILPSQNTEGINRFKFRIQLKVDEGFEAKTPLVKSLRLIAAKV